MESIDATLIDFANKYIGGGVLEGGCVQEEILFMCRPECIAARYFTEPLLDNEALIIRNAKVYSGYDGYGPSLEYKEYANECYECDVIAIDASYYKWRNSRLEFTKESILREVNKAYTGFLYSKGRIVTGNWGYSCPDVASKAKKELIYSSFLDEHFESTLKDIIRRSKNIAVGKLLEMILLYCQEAFKERSWEPTLFDWLTAKIE